MGSVRIIFYKHIFVSFCAFDEVVDGWTSLIEVKLLPYVVNRFMMQVYYYSFMHEWH